ncbi:hypothetical protein RhiirA5_418685 [Rhizophagus irregularis]|uniref:Uncharacterized protein n=1 Tax=Rhizophagus irregularis TaxID=588596 RepID=A0A2N0PJT9_9GLOM|nr:hypothetical protein RhiirA5_418685 [Rhizophagus irregularis]
MASQKNLNAELLLFEDSYERSRIKVVKDVGVSCYRAYSQDNFICDVYFHDNGFHERKSASSIPTYAIPTSTSTVSTPATAQNSLLNQKFNKFFFILLPDIGYELSSPIVTQDKYKKMNDAGYIKDILFKESDEIVPKIEEVFPVLIGKQWTLRIHIFSISF